MKAASRQKHEGAVRNFDLRKPGVKAGYILMYALAITAFLVAVMPLLWVALSGFKDIKEFSRGVKIGKKYMVQFWPTSFSLEGYLETWNQMKYVRYYVNSLWVALGSAAAALLFNGLFAYSLSRLRPKGYKLAYGLVMGTLMLPATTSVVPLLINITKVGLIGSFVPLWFGAGASAFYVVLLKNFYDGMPDSLLEAARLDGCNNLQLFFRIVVPLSMPINIVIIIYAVNAAWSDFLLPYLVLSGTKLETVMVRLFSYRTSDRVNEMDIIRAIVFSVIPPILMFIFFQRQITQNVTTTGMKG